jgi:hypothetical protein
VSGGTTAPIDLGRRIINGAFAMAAEVSIDNLSMLNCQSISTSA